MTDPLERLARRVENDSFFLASLLAEFARAEGLDDAALARELGCTVQDLTGVRLCRAPRPDPAGFRADVHRVAERFSVNADRLLEIVRQGQALRQLHQGGTAASGFLMAARDQPGEPAHPQEEKEP